MCKNYLFVTYQELLKMSARIFNTRWRYKNRFIPNKCNSQVLLMMTHHVDLLIRSRKAEATCVGVLQICDYHFNYKVNLIFTEQLKGHTCIQLSM